MVTSTIKTYKSVDPKEELLIDVDATIKETELTLGTLNQIKKTILDNSNIISDSLCSSLSQFTIEPTFPFPEFVHWVVENYVSSTMQILSLDGTRVIITINAETLRKAFCLPIPNFNSDQFQEENSLAIIKSLNSDQLYSFMSKMFQPDIIPSNYTFPYDISLVIETIQVVFSLVSQTLGFENDKSVTAVIVGTIFLVSQYVKEFALSFDQYLVDKISYQLQHFHSNGKVFNYQTLLLLMVIIENLTKIRQIELVNFLDVVDLSDRNATISFFTFANSIMPAIYRVFFGSTMPRISKDLNFLLQNPIELIGVWFCYIFFTVIRVYGFEGEPYKLPKFTTRRLFSLEFLRQRLIVENDNFLKYK